MLKREAKCVEMDEGLAVLPVQISNQLTSEEQAAFPEWITPWARAETDKTVLYFGFCHFEEDPDGGFKAVNKGRHVKGVMVMVFTEDWTGWPTQDQQVILSIECSPDEIDGTDMGLRLLREVIIRFAKAGMLK